MSLSAGNSNGGISPFLHDVSKPSCLSLLSSLVPLFFARHTSPLFLHGETMKVALGTSFASVAFALRSGPIPRLLVPEGSSALLHARSSTIRASTLRMGAASDAADGDGGGPFTRSSLLNGVTKTAGVLGAGAFVQKGFFSGTPYFGTPDLGGKVRGCKKKTHVYRRPCSSHSPDLSKATANTVQRVPPMQLAAEWNSYIPPNGGRSPPNGAVTYTTLTHVSHLTSHQLVLAGLSHCTGRVSDDESSAR